MIGDFPGEICQMVSVWQAPPAFLWEWISCRSCAFPLTCPVCAGCCSGGTGDSIWNCSTHLHWWWTYTIPWPGYSVLGFWCPEKHLQLCLKAKALFSLPVSNSPNTLELTQCNHRPQHDEFVENILQHPGRSSEDCFHLGETIVKGIFYSVTHPHSAHSEPAFRGTPLPLGWAGRIWKKGEIIWRVSIFKARI